MAFGILQTKVIHQCKPHTDQQIPWWPPHAPPPLAAYTQPWFNGRSMFHHSNAFEGIQEVHLGRGEGGGAGEPYHPILKINGKKKMSHICIYSIHLCTGGPHVDKRCHTYPIHLRTGVPNVDKGSQNYSIHICTRGPTVDQRKVTHIFDSSPHPRTNCGQRGKSHLCSMQDRLQKNTPVINVSSQRMTQFEQR